MPTTASPITSVAALRRALPVGAKVHVTNHLFPDCTRDAEVLRNTTRSVQLTHPRSAAGSWFDWPRRDELCSHADGTVTILTSAGDAFLTIRVLP